MFNKLKYDIVIPVLNEQRRLENGVITLYQFLKNNHIHNCKIIIADNGSTDKTPEISVQLAEKHPEIQYISLKNKGVGLALKTAWAQSEADVIGYMDVDLATDLKHMTQVISLFEEHKNIIINGSRNLPTSHVVNRKWTRRVTSWGFNKLLQLLLNVHFSDGMCGFKFISREYFKTISQYGLTNDGWFFCTELLYVGEKLNLSLIEIPVNWQDDGDSRVKIISLSLYYLKEILRLRYSSIGEKII